jgi:hypothetical protein
LSFGSACLRQAGSGQAGWANVCRTYGAGEMCEESETCTAKSGRATNARNEHAGWFAAGEVGSVGGVRERGERGRISYWEATRARPGDSWGVRVLRRTAIVWVPVVGISMAVGIKFVGWMLVRMVVGVFGRILRGIFA